jgi:hypothetical protein
MPLWVYFVLTLVIELPLVLLFFKKDRRTVLLVGFLLNLFTWPLLHVLLFNTSIHINMLEIGVGLTEGIGYWLLLGCRWPKGLAVGILVNAVSYGLGVWLQVFF